MANTVNDVMNVIASPDYGIKNIAGTTQEILAILQGTHNSQNNIHNIVDDVRNLLQELVVASTEKKKTIEIGDNSSKINQKHVKDILDETKGIRKAIISLEKAIVKQGKGTNAGVVKLSDKASDKVANAMVKNLEKQNKGGGMTALVDAFSKLKNISFLDIRIANKKIKKISELFKNAKEDLKIDEKDLNNIIKLIGATPEMINALHKVNWKLNRIIKNDTIQKLKNILIGENSILSISISLQKNKTTLEDGNKSAKNLKELISSLNKAMRKLFFASIWANLANGSFETINSILDNKLFPLAKKLSKNKKTVEKGADAAKKITTLVGNLLISSIFLTIAAVVAIPAMLGAMALGVIVDLIIPIGKTLSKNKKNMNNAVGAAIILTGFTALMMVTSLLLSLIAKNGITALLGSLIVLGIVTLNVFTFELLDDMKGSIIEGAISMAIMSLSLILFSIAVKKIVDATKGVTFKQVGVIAAITLLLGVSVAFLGALLEPILFGSITIAIMGFALRPFANTLAIIAQATEKMEMKHIELVNDAMFTLAFGISAMAILLIPVLLGSATLSVMTAALRPFVDTLAIIAQATEKLEIKHIEFVNKAMFTLAYGISAMSLLYFSVLAGSATVYAMGIALMPFVNTLKIISDIGRIPEREVKQVVDSLKYVGDFFKDNEIDSDVIETSYMYNIMMRPFVYAVHQLSKLKEIGSIPTKLVQQTLKAMHSIASYYVNNEISLSTIWQARRYKRMMRPFGYMVEHLSKLKKMGSIPSKLVHQTLKAMSDIASYYVNNEISLSTIWQARRYKRMMRPFGYMVEHLSKLKKMGSIPSKLVHQTLKAMSDIASYYVNNEIDLSTIRQARRYKRMMKPFGYMVENLSKLKKMGSIPIKLVHQALNAISTIADFYQNQDIGFFDGISANISSSMISGIVSSFGEAVVSLQTLKELKNIPTDAINATLDSLRHIIWYYITAYFSDEDIIEEKSKLTEMVVGKFTNMAKNIQDKLANIKDVNADGIISIVFACGHITNFYNKTKFFVSENKILRINLAIQIFVDNAKRLKNIEFTKGNYDSIKLGIKSMKKIVNFFKNNTLNPIQSISAKNNISMLNALSFTMKALSSINPSNMTSIGNALSDTLNGINTIDMDQIESVTNMFNAFNKISKSENVINKFTESIKEFTTACKNLMDAMGYNTDAINNMNTNADGGSSTSIIRENTIIERDSNNNTSQNNGIRITNVDEMARAIAEKINGSLSVDVPDSQIQLLINGTGGNEWTITKC
jgi:hypothetical protein